MSNEISSGERLLSNRKNELLDLEIELSEIIKMDKYSDADLEYAKEKYQKYINP